MMKKAKITLLTLLVAVLSLCCFAFIACNDDGGKGSNAGTQEYTVTWSVDQHLDVKVTGYDSLPAKVVDGTELSFTVTPKSEGWSILSVGPTANVKVQSDGSYKATITKDLEIRVREREDVESIDVKKPAGDINFYAGEKFLIEGENEGDALKFPEDWGFTAIYKTGREEELDPSKLMFEYAISGAEAFTLGDTSFTVKYGNGSATVELSQAVRGRITLDLDNGGKWGAEALAELNDKFGENNVSVKTEEKGKDKKKTNVCYILFDKAFEADYTLPAPVQTFTNKAGTSTDFNFKQWNGIENGKIAKDNAVSLKAEAIYNVELVDFYSLHFTTKDVTETVKVTEGEGEEAHEVDKQVTTKDVPFFVIDGKFVAADSAQLILKEGNAPVTELFGTKIEVSEDTDEFSLEFDLRQFVRWTNPDANASKKQTLINSWNDIRFRASLNGNDVDQIIDLNDYADDFVDLGDTLEAEVDGKAYQFAYQVWTGDGSVGRDLKLYYQNRPDVVAKNVTLVNHEFTVTTGEGEEATTTTTTLPAIAVTAKNFVADTEDVLKSYAENYLSNPQALDSWRGPAMKKDYTVDFANKTFTLYLSIDDVKQGEVVFFHMNNGGDNFYNCSIDNALLENGNDMYTLRLFSGATGDSNTWKNGLVVVEYKDKAAKETTANPVTIEVAGDKAYMVISGTYVNWTEQEFKAAIHLDFEDSSNGNNKIVLDADKITLEFNNDGTYTIKADVTDIEVGAWWVHLTGVLSGNGDVGNDDGFEPLTCGTKTFGYVEKTFDWGKKMLFTVGTAA